MPDAVAARALPQFTRSLRGFAAVHALGDPSHDRIFGPFIDARRRAHLARTLAAQLQALDAPTLRGALRDAIAATATDRWPDSPPDARALEALLDDAARPAFDALVLADRTARWLAGAGDEDRDRCWRGWVDALSALFRALDTFWVAVQPTIAPTPARLHAPIPAPPRAKESVNR